ncbi:MAG: OB-fold domain-containing protein [Acidimicrobiaceae bacterium]|nr:OB-fold domain-containing protein [Acidimicrobiaceae bacterium]MBO0747850.1 OB-fold domain-containing protein [Acidimicrobiaceae bacterium]
MDPVAYPDLLPAVTDANRPFWDGLREGELRLQSCTACGTRRYPESYVCPKCLSPDSTWQATSGRGRLWSWIVMHQRYFPASAFELPYNVAFVQLEEGPHLMSSLIEIPDGLRIDEPVEAVFVPVAGDRVIHKFRVLR